MRTLGIALGVFLSWSTSAQALSVAVVDVNRAMKATEHFAQAKAFIDGKSNELDDEIKKKQSELESRKEQLDAKRAVSRPEATLEEDRRLQGEAQMLAKQMMVKQQQLTQMKAAINNQLIQRLTAVISQIAAKKDLDYVFESGGTSPDANVVYFERELDITDEVVEVYRTLFKGKPLDLPNS